jgi:hypothetical protein
VTAEQREKLGNAGTPEEGYAIAEAAARTLIEAVAEYDRARNRLVTAQYDMRKALTPSEWECAPSFPLLVDGNLIDWASNDPTNRDIIVRRYYTTKPPETDP